MKGQQRSVTGRGKRKNKTEAKTRGVFERLKGSGDWWIRYADQYGQMHREKVGPKSLAIANYMKRKTEIREGKFCPEMIQPRKVLLFKDMAKLYIDEHAKVNKRSWKTDQQRADVLIEHFGSKPLPQIKRQDVERYRTKLTKDMSKATVNRYIALLKTIFNKAIEWEKAEHNPVKGIKQYAESHRVRYLTDEEEQELVKVFPATYWSWVEIAMDTGMRRGEQFGLRWEDINFQTRIITIPRSKNGEVRHIPMNDRVVEILRNLPSRFKGEYVFTSSNWQTPMDADNFVYRVFKPALAEAKIKDFRWHDLRHTFASRLVMAGEDIRTVQELMGHKNITMTMKYSHLSPKHLMEAVQRLAKNPTGTTTGTRQNEELS
ncbi:tyrosine-type recombinase/integrase [Thermodesulfobacteriota bacterium]